MVDKYFFGIVGGVVVPSLEPVSVGGDGCDAGRASSLVGACSDDEALGLIVIHGDSEGLDRDV